MLYWRLPRLLEALRIAHADGSYTALLKKIAKTELIALDDWGLSPTSAQDRAHLLEVLEIASASSPPPYSASCRLISGTPTSANRRLPTQSWIAWFIRATASL